MEKAAEETPTWPFTPGLKLWCDLESGGERDGAALQMRGCVMHSWPSANNQEPWGRSSTIMPRKNTLEREGPFA